MHSFKKMLFLYFSYCWYILFRTQSSEPHLICSDGRASEGTREGAGPWPRNLASCSDNKWDWIAHVMCVLVAISSQIAAKPSLYLYSLFPVPDIWSQTQHLSPNAVQVDKTVAEPESLKKLLIIWLMCIRLWECEINHQQWDELLKWILVFRLLSLGNGFSFLRHQVNRCRDAVVSLSQSQEQPVARQCLSLSPAAWTLY